MSSTPDTDTLTPARPGSPLDQSERRHSPDRRQFTVRTLEHGLLKPARHHARRSVDRRHAQLDIVDEGAAVLAIALMVLSILDALFTLTLISHGASELNPVMNYFLQFGPWVFVGVKLAVTAIAGVALVATANIRLFGRFRARSALAMCVGLYAGVVVYEIGLLTMV